MNSLEAKEDTPEGVHRFPKERKERALPADMRFRPAARGEVGGLRSHLGAEREKGPTEVLKRGWRAPWSV